MTDNNKGEYAVLFVDDEEKALKYFAKAMSGRLPVLTAGSVDGAIEILQQQSERIAVVVSDQRMPGKNGVELLKHVRQHYPAMVRLLTTAYSDLNDAIEAINRGEIYRYIQKPWHVESLQAEISGALHYFLLRRERDLLLAEKLSTRQRMTDVQRLAQLMVYAQTMQGLPNVDYGMQNFLELLHTFPVSREADNLLNVDQWELTRWDSKRSSDFFNALQLRLPHTKGTAEEQLSAEKVELLLHEVAADFELELAVQGGSSQVSWQGHAAQLIRLLSEVCALFALLRSGSRAPSCQLSAAEAPYSKSSALALSFSLEEVDWPTDGHLLSGSLMTRVNPLYQHLLAISLLTAALGGRHHMELSGESLSLRIVLPQENQEVPELGWDWQTDVLAAFEPAIEEFYPDL